MTALRVFGLGIVLTMAALSWAFTCSAHRYDRVIAGISPLDPRHFPRLTLITVGTGGAFENLDRRGPAMAVALAGRIVLVDAGRGVSEALRASGIPVSQPDTVFLTSLLPENTVGLDDLLLSGWLDGRKQPLRLVGPPGTTELARALTAGHQRGVAAAARARDLPPAAARFHAIEVAGGWSERLGELAVRAGEIPGGPLEALAYRFEWRDRSAVVGSAGWGLGALEDFARGANVLVHELVLVPTPELAAQSPLEIEPETARREAALHTGIHEVGALARGAGVETLVLVRLQPPPVYDFQLTSQVDDYFDGRIVVATDGDEIRP